MDLKGNLNSFSYYFTRYFEEQLLYWRHVLEESPDLKQKMTSKPVSILSSLASAIPTVGKALGSGITEGEKYINKRIDKNKASDIASIAYTTSDDMDLLRNNLIEGAYMVFCCYEYQFSKVTCENGGVTKAMQKIAQDASNRLFTYLLKDEETKIITWDVVAKGILYGESKRNTTNLLNFGRTLNIIEDNSTITTSDFFINCGVRIKHDNIITYYIKENHIPSLGHRLLFEFEDKYILEHFTIESPTYFHKYHFISCPKQQEIEDIYQYIARKDPMENLKEFAKFTFEEQLKLFEEASAQRQDIASKLLEDSSSKQKETKESIEASQHAIMNHLEVVLAKNTKLIISKTDEISQKHEEISKDVAVLKEKDEKRSSEGGTVIVIDLDKVKSEGQRLGDNVKYEGQKLGENVKHEAKKVAQEARRFHRRIKNIKL